MKIPELLVPIGSRTCLDAAVANGCDAVYLGGKRFNARNTAENFADNELADIIDYCHVRGVLVYITVNTIYGDSELHDVADFCEKAYRAGADAFIMQDVGAAFFVKNIFPGIKLIASTQMTIGDSLGAEILSDIFDRIIIARESSLEAICKITDISRTKKIETEVFVHGALCVCHSGQCLMSSMIGGRSGNRGRCAQPCRLRYDLTGHDKTKSGGYLLSPRDLCTLEILPEIVSTGVDSLKIEGRMKSPEYVALTTSLYRRRLDAIANGDSEFDPETIDQLLRVFNRGGIFTEGYFNSHGGVDMMSFETPKNTGVYVGNIESCRPSSKKAVLRPLRDLVPGDGIEVWTETEPHAGTYINKQCKAAERAVIDIEGRLNCGDKVYLTYDKRLMDGLRDTRSDLGKISVEAKVFAKKGKHIRLELKYGEIHIITEGALCEAAEKHPLTAADLEARLRKTGQTTFIFNFKNVQVDADIYIGVKDLNELRRQASEELTKKIIERSKRSYVKKSNLIDKNEDIDEENFRFSHRRDGIGRTNNLPVLSVLCSNSEQIVNVVDSLISLKNSLCTGDNIIFESRSDLSENAKNALLYARSMGLKVYSAFPRIISGDRGLYSKYIDGLPKTDGFLLRNFGQLQYMKEYCKNDKNGKNIKNTELIADFTFNAFNSMSVALLQEMGFDAVTLSPELDLYSMQGIAKNNTEIIIHGRIPLMITNQCPVGNQDENRRKYCTKRGENVIYSLRDGLGLEFPILTDCENCVAQILNSKPVFTLNKLKEILSCGAGRLRLSFTTESPSEAAAITAAYKTALDQDQVDGRISQKIRGFYEMGVTNGHFFRGVL